MKPWALTALALLVIAGVAVAAVAVVVWLPARSGVYTGPGIPYTTEGSFTLAGDGSWHAQPFQVNSSQFNVTECFTESATPATAVWGLFMNESEFDEFNVNSTLTHLGNQSLPGCFGPVHVVNGPGPFYFVWVDTANSAVIVQYSITVGVDAPA